MGTFSPSFDIYQNDNCSIISDFKDWYSPRNIENLNLIHVNIRSIRKNWDIFLVQIHDILDSLDIIVLTETSIKDYENNLYNIPLFDKVCINEIHSNHGIYRGRGIIIFHKINVNFSLESDHIAPAEVLHLKINNFNCHISLIAVYRSPSTDTSAFLKNFSKWLENNKNISNMLIIGDINIDIKNYSKPIVEEYLNVCSLYGLEHKINEFTRVEILNGNVTKSCIDRILLKTNKLNSSTAICLKNQLIIIIY